MGLAYQPPEGVVSVLSVLPHLLRWFSNSRLPAPDRSSGRRFRDPCRRFSAPVLCLRQFRSPRIP